MCLLSFYNHHQLQIHNGFPKKGHARWLSEWFMNTALNTSTVKSSSLYPLVELLNDVSVLITRQSVLYTNETYKQHRTVSVTERENLHRARGATSGWNFHQLSTEGVTDVHVLKLRAPRMFSRGSYCKVASKFISWLKLEDHTLSSCIYSRRGPIFSDFTRFSSCPVSEQPWCVP